MSSELDVVPTHVGVNRPRNLYRARLDLTTLAVMSEGRWEGSTDLRGCHAKKRLTRLAPHGDGTGDKPILALHVEWRDFTRSDASHDVKD